MVQDSQALPEQAAQQLCPPSTHTAPAGTKPQRQPHTPWKITIHPNTQWKNITVIYVYIIYIYITLSCPFHEFQTLIQQFAFSLEIFCNILQ